MSQISSVFNVAFAAHNTSLKPLFSSQRKYMLNNGLIANQITYSQINPLVVFNTNKKRIKFDTLNIFDLTEFYIVNKSFFDTTINNNQLPSLIKSLATSTAQIQSLNSHSIVKQHPMLL